MSMLHAALQYADLGYAIFPCAAGRKTPLTPRGHQDATTDTETITAWWTRNKDANIAIRTDGLLVVDVDGDDSAWLGDQDERWTDMAMAPSARTPRGGRHFLFRQPTGRSWRCTQGRLAERVDTRANGGYIVAPPSIVDGRAYRWLESYELDVPPDRLPEPPGWLIERLDRISAMAAAKPALESAGQQIAEGRRNGVLTSYAGTMRRAGMSEAEISAALLQANTDRCDPPLSTDEVTRIAHSVARYAPGAIPKSHANGHEGAIGSTPIVPRSIRELGHAFPALRESVIHGLLRRGETMNVIAPPKTGKSWLVIDLALAIASGRVWLNCYQTTRGDVLILDNELHGETSANRVPRVAEARGIPADLYADRLFVVNLRGQLRDLFSMEPFFQSIERDRFRVVILDAFYRFMPRDMDENDNGTMANLYNHLDWYAEQLGCCFVLIHHTTKGSQAGKSVTDVGAGAGSQSRATDTHLIMRPHEEPDSIVLDAAVRSWPPVLSQCLRWTFPVWMPANDLDPTLLRKENPKRAKHVTTDAPPPPTWTVEQFVGELMSEKPLSKAEIREQAVARGLSWRRIADLLSIAESKKLIFRWQVGREHRVLFATVPPPARPEVAL
ncbi:MAG: bifunctional DNA primase/polymerase [Phycisphaerae bacterium]|nr:bifunctional DNA primase/polymerase [Phycisphaerae bacterium]